MPQNFGWETSAGRALESKDNINIDFGETG
jgi:hypothetical protein